MRFPERVTIVEVGPRDGLQNEISQVSTADKIGFVDRLSASGVPVVEVSAFVSPKWVPAMADASAVFAGIARGLPSMCPAFSAMKRSGSRSTSERSWRISSVSYSLIVRPA